MAKSANKAPRNPACFCFISSLTVSFASINMLESSNDFIILIISFIYLIEINKINPFPVLTVLFPLIFLSNFFIAFEGKLLINPDKYSLAKEIAIIVNDLFAKLPYPEPKDPPD